MTTDLEKQFFDTFGIEPEPIYSELWADELVKYEYPEITDRHYIEFVRICCNECPWEFPSDFKNVEELKRFLIYNITQLEYIDRVKKQIIELFKE